MNPQVAWHDDARRALRVLAATGIPVVAGVAVAFSSASVIGSALLP